MTFHRKISITAHRGASGLAPENTLAAIRKAIEIGADFSEVDVHLNGDGELVLLHDDTVERTTNGTGFIWEWKSVDIAQLDAGSWFSAEFKNETIPTLSQILQVIGDCQMKLNIEIKYAPFQPTIVERLVDMIRTKHFENRCVITSFDKPTIEKVMLTAPELTTGLILDQEPVDGHFRVPVQLLSLNYVFITPNVMAKAVKFDKEIYAWTVNDLAEMKRMAHLGVHNIITNFPDRALQVRNDL